MDEPLVVTVRSVARLLRPSRAQRLRFWLRATFHAAIGVCIIGLGWICLRALEGTSLHTWLCLYGIYCLADYVRNMMASVYELSTPESALQRELQRFGCGFGLAFALQKVCQRSLVGDTLSLGGLGELEWDEKGIFALQLHQTPTEFALQMCVVVATILLALLCIAVAVYVKRLEGALPRGLNIVVHACFAVGVLAWALVARFTAFDFFESDVGGDLWRLKKCVALIELTFCCATGLKALFHRIRRRYSAPSATQ